MTRPIIYIGILFFAVSCGRGEFRPATGDLLFQVGESSAMGGAIESATGKNGRISFTHVGIAIRSDAADSVIEATTDGGVRLTSLKEFLDRSARIGVRPVVAAMRLRDTTGIAAAVARARTCKGQPYDYSYLPENGRMYCSELVWESYLAPDSSHLFTARPMNFRAADGTMPAFWSELFEKLGEPIPQGVPGTNPMDMSQDPALKSIHSYYK